MQPVSLERSLQQTVARHLHALAARDHTFAWRKRHGSAFATAGDPDIHGVWAGVPFEIELKRPGGNPTPLQLTRLAQWRQAGAHTFVVHSIPELAAALTEIRAHHSPPKVATHA